MRNPRGGYNNRDVDGCYCFDQGVSQSQTIDTLQLSMQEGSVESEHDEKLMLPPGETLGQGSR